jgi:hypothetical protein
VRSRMPLEVVGTGSGIGKVFWVICWAESAESACIKLTCCCIISSINQRVGAAANDMHSCIHASVFENTISVCPSKPSRLLQHLTMAH